METRKGAQIGGDALVLTTHTFRYSQGLLETLAEETAEVPTASLWGGLGTPESSLGALRGLRNAMSTRVHFLL